MNEEAIRERAHTRNNQGRDTTVPSRDQYYTGDKESKLLGDEFFRDHVAEYIESIPVDPAKLPACPACEGVLCGLCGKCHELDRQSWHTDVACPAAQYMHQQDSCVAWSYAYLFLKDAEKGEYAR